MNPILRFLTFLSRLLMIWQNMSAIFQNGALKPPGSSKAKKSFATTPLNVSIPSSQKGLSSKETNAMTFLEFLKSTASAVAAVETVISNAGLIYNKLAELIASTEAAFKSLVGAGAMKKTIVLAAISVFVTQLGQAWNDIKDLLSAFIDSVIGAYNAVTVVTDAATDTSTVTTA